MSWIKKLIPSVSKNRKKGGVPEGIWTKCVSCQAVLYRAELAKALYVCYKCDQHMRLTARQRLDLFLDADTPREDIGMETRGIDRLQFKDSKRYSDRLEEAEKKTGESEALIVQQGTLLHQPVVVSVFDFNFMGGSMGCAVGQRFVDGVHRAIEQRIPFINFSASGGARMQEALFSLMQMAKTSAALAKLAEQCLPYISILTDPTMGGVSASLAMLGDIIIAEPKSLIGFAGPRVIEQTVRQKLPEGFQSSEFLLEHGHIDMIVERKQLRHTVARLLAKLLHRADIDELLVTARIG